MSVDTNCSASYIDRNPIHAMSDHAIPGRSLLRCGVIGAFWTLVGLAFASQFYLSSTLLGRTVTWGQAIGYSLGDWYVWAVLSVPILFFARRFPPESGNPWRAVGVHLIAALVCSLVYVLLRALVGQIHSRLV